MLCLLCNKNEAVKDDTLGYIPCAACQNKGIIKANRQIEMAGEEIRQARSKYADDIVQPHRKGILNKRWVELRGKERALAEGYTEKEIAEAKDVYAGDDTYYKSEG